MVGVIHSPDLATAFKETPFFRLFSSALFFLTRQTAVRTNSSVEGKVGARVVTAAVILVGTWNRERVPELNCIIDATAPT